MTKPRMVIVTVDTLLEIMKDYLGPDNIPPDATVASFKVNPSEQGKFAIEIESPNLAYTDLPLNVHYRNKRVYGVGGGTS